MGIELVIAFLVGGVLGVAGWSWVIARDDRVVRLQEDEVVIKRPLENYVLLQVTPDIARQVVNSWGKTDPATGEARSLYANRYLRARRQADALDEAEKTPESV